MSQEPVYGVSSLRAAYDAWWQRESLRKAYQGGSMTMTEAQWLASTDPQEMLHFLEGKVSERQRRLFACAWWRSIEPHDEDHEALAVAVEQQQEYQDPDTDETIDADWLLCDCSANTQQRERGAHLHRERGAAFLRDIVGNPFRPVACADGEDSTTYPSHPDDCRCLLRPWLTRDVLGLAEAIYEERAWERMPILADALEEAGADNEDLLRHCRGWERCPKCGGTGRVLLPSNTLWSTWSPCRDVAMPGGPRGSGCDGSGWIALRGPHVRGCHVIDLLLGLS
jgi:hypothetical protein